MDPCVACETLNIPPYYCFVVSGYTVPSKPASTWADGIALKLKGVFECDLEVFPVYDSAGVVFQQLLVKCPDKATFEKCKKVYQSGEILIDTVSYHVKSVWFNPHESPDPTIQKHCPVPFSAPDKKGQLFVRRLKNFSGDPKPPHHEADIHEWLLLAKEVLKDKELTDLDKCRVIKNSLIKTALTLASSYEVKSAKELVDLISLSYGAARSPEHIYSQLFQMKQGNQESPSAFLARIQNAITSLSDVNAKLMCQPEEFLMKRFIHGLRPSDFELIEMRLKWSEKTDNFPQFSEMFQTLQMIERGRRERCERDGSGSVYSHALRFSHELVEPVNTPTAHDLDLIKEFQSTTKKLESALAELGKPKKPKDKGSKSPKDVVTAKLEVDVKPRTDDVSFSSSKQRYQRKARCWGCDETGHYFTDCPHEPDYDLVAQRMKAARAKRQADRAGNQGN